MGYDTTRFGRDYYADMDKYKIPKVRCWGWSCVYVYAYMCGVPTPFAWPTHADPVQQPNQPQRTQNNFN